MGETDHPTGEPDRSPPVADRRIASGFVAELRRRGVLRAVLAYAVIAFAVLQVVEPVVHGLRLPDWTLSVVIVAVAAGFPLTMAVSWAFDLTRHGFRRAPPAAGRDLTPTSRTALVVFALAVAGAGAAIVWLDRPWRSPRPLTLAAADFINETHDDDLNALSGLLITSLQQSRRLSVVTRTRMFDLLKQIGRQDASRIDEALGREICRHARIEALAVAAIHRFGEVYAIDLRVVDPARDEHLFAAREEGRGKESIPAMIDRIAERTRAGLRERAEEISAARTPVSIAATANLEAYRHFFRGEELIARGDLVAETALVTEGASRELRRAIELDPDFALAHFRLGFVLDWMGKRGALEEEETALAREERLPPRELCHARALRASHQGDLPEAIRQIRACAARFPDEKFLFMQAGDWSFHSGDLAGSVDAFEKALAADPTFIPALEHLLSALQGLGRGAEAADRARAYASRAKDDIGYELVAFAQGAAGNVEGALETLRKGMTAFPGSARLALAIVRAQMFLGRPAEAELAIRPLESIDAIPAHWATVRLDAYRGRYRRVIAACEEGAAKASAAGDPELAEKLLVSKAFELTFGLGDRRAAADEVAALEALVSDEPWMFDVYLGLGMEDKAAALLPRYGRSGRLRLAAFRARAKGQTRDAIEAQERLINIPYQEHKHLYDLAGLYLESGQAPKAIATLRSLQRIYPSTIGMPFFLHWYPRSFYLLGKAYESAGDPGAALASYDRFLELWKDADAELPELSDARTRAARLRSVSRD